MRRVVRVVLTATVGQFNSGIRSALNSFTGLVSGVTSGAAAIGMILTGINSAVQLVTGAFRAMGNAVKWAHNTFLEGAIASERNRVALTSLVQDADLAAQIMDDVRERTMRYGLDAREAEFATVQLSMALRGMYGEVDPSKLTDLQDMMLQITTIRPDIVGGAQAVGRGIAAAISGDFTTLTRLIDLPLTKIQGLSAETQALLQGGEKATEQTLGTVTKLGEQTGQSGGDYIKALREILDAAGITSDLVDDMTDTTSGQLAILKANWQTFTDDVGKAFLPSLNEALEKFTELVAEHQPEIEAFADTLGKWAGINFEKLIDFLFEQDWEKIAKDVERLGRDGFGSLSKFIQETDWETIAEAIGAIAEAIVAVKDFVSQEDSNNWLDRTFGPGGTIGSPTDYSQSVQQQPEWVQPSKDAVAGFLNNILGSNSQQEVKVTVSVDDDGKLIASQERVARNVVGNVINAATDSTHPME